MRPRGTADMPARFPHLPPQGDDPRRVATVVNLAMRGKINAVAALALSPGASTTALMDDRIGADSVVLLMPTTANGAAALATTYVATLVPGEAAVSHLNNAQTDRSFAVVIIG